MPKFLTIDADRAFWHIQLRDGRSNHVTFISPFDRYKFKVMPHGISSATEIF